jgi:hypothetical protein
MKKGMKKGMKVKEGMKEEGKKGEGEEERYLEKGSDGIQGSATREK